SNTGTLTLSGIISGANALTKADTGTLILSAANSYTGATTINAGTLQLSGSGRLADTTAVTADGTFDLNDISDTIGSLAGSGSVLLGSGTLTTGGDGSSTTFSGVMSETGSLIKAGAGTFTLSNANTYIGTTTINAGTLQLSGSGRLADSTAMTVGASGTFDLNDISDTIGSLAGSGSVLLGSGTLTAGGDASSTTFSGVISETGNLTKAGSGVFTLSGANTYTGATTINAGTIQLGAAGVISDSSAVSFADVAGAVLDLNNFNETVGSIAGGGATGGNITLGSGTLTAGGNNATTTYSGLISGSGGVTKVGNGTLTLGQDNTYTGVTRIETGTLELGSANAIPAASTLYIASTGTLGLGGFSKTLGGLTGDGNINLGTATLTINNSADNTYSGVLSGSGNLVKSNSGVLTLEGLNSYTGSTSINAGTLRAGVANGFSSDSAVTVASGATFDLNNFANQIASLAGAGDVTLGSAVFTVSGANDSTFSGIMSGTGSLIKAGASVFTLSGANTYTGTTTINAGTLQVAHNAGLGTGDAVVSAGQLLLSNATVANNLTLNGSTALATAGSAASGVSGNITLGSDTTITTTNSGDTLTLSGTLNGAYALTFAGSGELTLNGVIGGGSKPSSLTTGSNGTTRIGANIATTGTQTYNNPVAILTDVSLGAIDTGSLVFNNSLSGQVITLWANNSGLSRVALNGASTLQGIKGAATGDNTFTFGTNATYTGTINGQSAGLNTIDYSGYGSPISASFNALTNGTVNNFSFSNINNLIASTDSTLTVGNQINITAFSQGNLNAPTTFSNFRTIRGQGNTSVIFNIPTEIDLGSGKAFMSGGTMQFFNISFYGGQVVSSRNTSTANDVLSSAIASSLIAQESAWIGGGQPIWGTGYDQAGIVSQVQAMTNPNAASGITFGAAASRSAQQPIILNKTFAKGASLDNWIPLMFGKIDITAPYALNYQMGGFGLFDDTRTNKQFAYQANIIKPIRLDLAAGLMLASASGFMPFIGHEVNVKSESQIVVADVKPIKVEEITLVASHAVHDMNEPVHLDLTAGLALASASGFMPFIGHEANVKSESQIVVADVKPIKVEEITLVASHAVHDMNEPVHLDLIAGLALASANGFMPFIGKADVKSESKLAAADTKPVASEEIGIKAPEAFYSAQDLSFILAKPVRLDLKAGLADAGGLMPFKTESSLAAKPDKGEKDDPAAEPVNTNLTALQALTTELKALIPDSDE
ncbi:MAG: outer membrane autotransporter barrel protein, partial [uncultured bacterium]